MVQIPLDEYPNIFEREGSLKKYMMLLRLGIAFVRGAVTYLEQNPINLVDEVFIY
jgi:hypothetical protein